MNVFQIIAAIVTVTAAFNYLNYRFLRLPTTVGLMLSALVTSILLIAIGRISPAITSSTVEAVRSIRFDDTLMQGMLCVLLFAGALHIDLGELIRERRIIGALSIGGVLISTVVFGPLMFFVFHLLHLEVSWGWCFLLGALISPTDPIAVIEVLKPMRVRSSLKTQIAGESLLNDGIGVVVFTILYRTAIDGKNVSIGNAVGLFLQEAVGGAIFGAVIGWIAYRLLKSIDQYGVEILLTLALVLGGYAAAAALHLSGPIAIVVAGFLIGNQGRSLAMSEKTREHLDNFWAINDEILNAVLFVLIGLELLTIELEKSIFLAGLLAIPAILFARYVSVALPIGLLGFWQKQPKGTIAIMTWGGLRGGISIAMALSLPPSKTRDLVVAVTYLIVVFSIVVQGLTIERLAKRTATLP